jgi:hypothetical protein
MTLDQVAKKHGINPNNLNAKDDALKIGVKSIQQLVSEMEKRKIDNDLINAVKKLGTFMYEVSDSTIG